LNKAQEACRKHEMFTWNEIVATHAALPHEPVSRPHRRTRQRPPRQVHNVVEKNPGGPSKNQTNPPFPFPN
jgi:hypothetical protein